jgi:hypothetical protein
MFQVFDNRVGRHHYKQFVAFFCGFTEKIPMAFVESVKNSKHYADDHMISVVGKRQKMNP